MNNLEFWDRPITPLPSAQYFTPHSDGLDHKIIPIIVPLQNPQICVDNDVQSLNLRIQPQPLMVNIDLQISRIGNEGHSSATSGQDLCCILQKVDDCQRLAVSHRSPVATSTTSPSSPLSSRTLHASRLGKYGWDPFDTVQGFIINVEQDSNFQVPTVCCYGKKQSTHSNFLMTHTNKSSRMLPYPLSKNPLLQNSKQELNLCTANKFNTTWTSIKSLWCRRVF
jgi:hypothetical protein